jgi:hypothetical protein
MNLHQTPLSKKLRRLLRLRRHRHLTRRGQISARAMIEDALHRRTRHRLLSSGRLHKLLRLRLVARHHHRRS